MKLLIPNYCPNCNKDTLFEVINKDLKFNELTLRNYENCYCHECKTTFKNLPNESFLKVIKELIKRIKKFFKKI